MKNIERRYDIDWLRVIAIGLLLIYHIAIGFQPWGVFIGFIQNSQSMQELWTPMSMLNVWRIPLLFFVSGMGVCFAMRKRNVLQLLKERTQRILVPFLFGIVAIVPLHILLWQHYYNQDISYIISRGHLWFLLNILTYVFLLLPIIYFLNNKQGGKVKYWLTRIFSHPMGLLLVMACFVVEVLIVQPSPYELYAMTWHGYWLGLIAFLFGFAFVYSGDAFWNTVRKWKWMFLVIAILLFAVRYTVFQLKAPNYLMAIETNTWIYAVFGFANKYLNKPGKTLSYLSQAAYPVYIIHMIFLYLGSYFIFPAELTAAVKLILLIVFTFVGCFVTYEYLIRRVSMLRVLFGLKLDNQNGMLTTFRSRLSSKKSVQVQ